MRQAAVLLFSLAPGGAVMAAEPCLPVVLEVPQAVYPPDALSSRREAAVVLQLLVSDEGRVVEAEVVEAAGGGFDEAALAAARDLRFSPALDASGQPVISRVLYRWNFELTEVATVALQGQVRVAGTRQPAPATTLLLRGPDRAQRSARTDDEGRFSLAGLVQGGWTVTLSDPRFEPVEILALVSEGAVASIRMVARPVDPVRAPASDVLQIEVVTERGSADVVQRRLTAEELRVLPGSAGDVLRAVQNLPGVARSPFGLGQLIVRGHAPEDTRYSLDGMDIPLVFHFGGLTSVITGDSIDEVVFLPGGFGVRYGRNLGGRLDIRTRTDLPERSRGYVSLDLFQATGFAALRTDERTTVFLSARRSYADTVLTPVLSNSSQRFRAPRYYDAQLRMLHKPGTGGSLDLYVVMSDDRFATFDAEQPDDIGVRFATTFQKVRLRWVRPLANGWTNELSLLFGPDEQSLQVGEDNEAFERRVAVNLREEVTADVSGSTSWRLGLDVAAGRERYVFDVSSFGESERGDALYLAPALYVEPTLRAGIWTLTPGLRADLLARGAVTSWSVDPRLAVLLDASATTRLRASIGRYSQFPTLRQATSDTEGLRPAWALQTSLGLDQTLPRGMSLEITGWFNHLENLVVGREDTFRFFTTPPPQGPVDTGPYDDVGRGWTGGLELGWRLQTQRVAALLSATFGRSQRVDREGRAELFQFDQPWLVTALATGQLPKRWRLGGRVRAASGNPLTPVTNRVYDLDAGGFVPIFGDRFSDRLGPFFSLDLRVDKEWVFRSWVLTWYLDVLNVTNTRNIEVPTWSPDYRTIEGIRGLPIVPVFGLRGDW